jgi:hypothetical protein
MQFVVKLTTVIFNENSYIGSRVNHFYCPANALNYTNLEVKIYVVYKCKRQKIKNHSDMFRILCDPSSGSSELCLT